ncbi:LytTR family DNA-binding domain-containing protein [Runella sp.]|uniref:LytR/AlgR family response regulator transcription factor n=1 Tax=Runella sp. TaxID=1960881 RepID=UPI00301AA8CE
MIVSLPSPSKLLQGIFVLQRNHRTFIEFSSILRLQAERNYTWIYLQNGQKILSSKTLMHYATILPSDFVRVHKSHIVNRSFFLGMSQKRHEIYLTDYSVICITQRHVKKIREILLTPLQTNN